MNFSLKLKKLFKNDSAAFLAGKVLTGIPPQLQTPAQTAKARLYAEQSRRKSCALSFDT